MKVIGNIDRMNVVLDTEKKEIEVTQFWHFRFRLHPTLWRKARYLNHAERTAFKSKVKKVIQRLWDNKVGLELVSATDPKLLPYAGTVFNIRIHIQEANIEQAAHWKVSVMMIPKGGNEMDSVNWINRTITINTESTKQHQGPSENDMWVKQYPVAHEFGHAFGNATRLECIGMTADEYNLDNPYFYDEGSIMNVGNYVRKRHYEYIRYVLEKLVMPGTEFKTKIL